MTTMSKKRSKNNYVFYDNWNNIQNIRLFKHEDHAENDGINRYVKPNLQNVRDRISNDGIIVHAR